MKFHDYLKQKDHFDAIAEKIVTAFDNAGLLNHNAGPFSVDEYELDSSGDVYITASAWWGDEKDVQKFYVPAAWFDNYDAQAVYDEAQRRKQEKERCAQDAAEKQAASVRNAEIAKLRELTEKYGTVTLPPVVDVTKP